MAEKEQNKHYFQDIKKTSNALVYCIVLPVFLASSTGNFKKKNKSWGNDENCLFVKRKCKAMKEWGCDV